MESTMLLWSKSELPIGFRQWVVHAQDFNSILKTYVSRQDKDLNRLMEYAKLFRVDNVIHRYMGVLL